LALLFSLEGVEVVFLVSSSNNTPTAGGNLMRVCEGEDVSIELNIERGWLPPLLALGRTSSDRLLLTATRQIFFA